MIKSHLLYQLSYRGLPALRSGLRLFDWCKQPE